MTRFETDRRARVRAAVNRFMARQPDSELPAGMTARLSGADARLAPGSVRIAGGSPGRRTGRERTP